MSSPVCGYPPQTIQEILGKTLNGKAKIIDGRHQIAPGLIIHPAFRGHTYGSQLLQVNTASRPARVRQRHLLVLGRASGTGYVANIQQTDTIQQFLAYEKCYVLTSRLNSFHNCIAAHEPMSYTRRVSRSRPTGGTFPRTLLAGRRADPGARRVVSRSSHPNRTPPSHSIGVPPHPIRPVA